MTPPDDYRGLASVLLQHFKASEMGSTGQPKPPRPTHRIVAIVGAGVSAAAGLPLGQELKKALFDALTKGETAPLTAAGALAECLSYVNRIPGNLAGLRKQLTNAKQTELPKLLIEQEHFDFLHFCEALSLYPTVRNFIADKIIERLRTLRTRPVLAYELLAHLLNHKFIDHIISLNFDTLLDESLRDEMGNGGLHFAVSERDVPNLFSGDASHLSRVSSLPWFIKPHGSLTATDSLRFTLNETNRVPGAMRQLIEFVLCGDIKYGPNGSPGNSTDEYTRAGDSRPKLVLITLGWAFKEELFWDILARNKNLIDTVYIFCPTNDLPLQQRALDLNGILKPGSTRLLRFEMENNGLDGSILKIFGHMFRESSTTSAIRLPPISRHLLYCYCFPSEPKASEQPSEPQLVADRLWFEIFYFSLKTKGAFSTHALSQIYRAQRSLTARGASVPGSAAGGDSTCRKDVGC